MLKAPVLDDDKYGRIFNKTIHSAYALIEALEYYPAAPKGGDLLHSLRTAQRKSDQKRFDEARIVVNRALEDNSDFFGYDAGDSVTRGILKSTLSLLRTASQNILDNAIRASKDRQKRPQTRCLLPDDFQVSSKALHASSKGDVSDGSSRRTPSAVSSSKSRIRSRFGSSSDLRAVHSNNSSIDPRSTSIHKPSGSPNTVRTLSRTYDGQELDSDEEREYREWCDSFTAEDERNFDWATYYGSDTWFLE